MNNQITKQDLQDSLKELHQFTKQDLQDGLAGLHQLTKQDLQEGLAGLHQLTKQDLQDSTSELRGEMKSVFDGLSERIDDLTINTKMGFDDLGNRVDRNTNTIDRLSNRMTHIEDDLGSFIKKWDSEQAANQLRFRRIEEKLV